MEGGGSPEDEGRDNHIKGQDDLPESQDDLPESQDDLPSPWMGGCGRPVVAGKSEATSPGAGRRGRAGEEGGGKGEWRRGAEVRPYRPHLGGEEGREGP